MYIVLMGSKGHWLNGVSMGEACSIYIIVAASLIMLVQMSYYTRMLLAPIMLKIMPA